MRLLQRLLCVSATQGLFRLITAEVNARKVGNSKQKANIRLGQNQIEAHMMPAPVPTYFVHQNPNISVYTLPSTMATLVFRSPAGPLIQTQIGAADVVATFHAAHSAWGWLGGLQSIRSLLNAIPNKLVGQSTKLCNLKLEPELRLLPTCAYILASSGPQEFFADDATHSFGDDPRTQIIGLTICALAHELRVPWAVMLFQKCLLRHLFQAPNELLDAMETQLSDYDIRQRIINEGASRGLTTLFNDAVGALNLPPGDCGWVKAEIKKDWYEHMDYEPSEVHMVGGMLRWISHQSTTPYFTRSGLVARTAVYLKTVGYMIGVVEYWDGLGNPPSSLGPNAIVLVLGGSSTTDELMLETEEIEVHHPYLISHHYSSRTVGSLLLNALGNPPSILPEILQDDFEHVRDYVESHLSTYWTTVSNRDMGINVQNISLAICCKWNGAAQSTSIERSLAGIYFPLSGEFLAPCYRRVASEQFCMQVRDGTKRRIDATSNTMHVEIARFRAITAAIYIALASCLAQKGDFQKSCHLTNLQLINEAWLDPECQNIDRFGSGSIRLQTAVHVLAVVHAGDFARRIDENITSNTIGFREGIYSVLPTLLVDKEPTSAALNFVLSDRFFANISANNRGEIKDINSPRILNEYANPDPRRITDNSALTTLQEPWSGPPFRHSPDLPLYLGLERHSNGEMGFVGRIDGSNIGKTSIRDVLFTIVRSLKQPDDCNHQDEYAIVQNVKASRWALKSRIYKPAGFHDCVAYISVLDNAAWTLFLAGEAMIHNSVIVYRCTICAGQCYDSHGDKVSVLIGYK
jgi:hypothetical protein